MSYAARRLPARGVCSERRLPRKFRNAKLSGSLDVGQIFRLPFWLGKKGGRPPGRDPASSRQQGKPTPVRKPPRKDQNHKHKRQALSRLRNANNKKALSTDSALYWGNAGPQAEPLTRLSAKR